MRRSILLRVWNQRQPKLFWLIFACTLCLLALLSPHTSVPALAQASSSPSQHRELLPEAQVHPLPTTLAAWKAAEAGDYFSEIEPTPVGYLIWSNFPVTVFVEPIEESTSDRHASPPFLTPLAEQSQSWVEAVTQAIQDWQVYLPLELVETPDTADIAIWRSVPPLQALIPQKQQSEGSDSNPSARGIDLPRARSAETRYYLFVDRSGHFPGVLSHRFTIQLSPNQTFDYVQAAARHELGHALGIWGHSPLETDALYFAQVRYPPVISRRDINTLKRIYEQPTQIGWSVRQP
ncbi:MAG: hypothetical protein Kow00121_44130 [Elainellaceae cyanobacterium]